MNNYTTKTASLLAAKIKGTLADVTYLNIDGTPFSKVISSNVPESPTSNDIWKYAATTDEEGVVTINTDVTVDYTELTDAQKDILKTTVKVIDNKVLDANDTVLMNWDTKNFTSDEALIHIDEENQIIQNIFGTKIDESTGGIVLAPITEWNSDLSNLTNSSYMFFYCTALKSFNGDLSNLTNGSYMFVYNTALKSFSGDLSSLINGSMMFGYCTALTSFNGDLSSLTSGNSMFANTALESFNSDMPSLTNGSHMFASSRSLTSFSGDMPSLIAGNLMFHYTSLESFEGDLSSLTNGYWMFYKTALKSFSGDLSSLTNGYRMFGATPLKSFSGDLSSLIDGTNMFEYTALQSFSGDLSSLTDGREMFNDTALESFNSNLPSLENGLSMFSSTSLTSWNIDLPSLINGEGMFYGTTLASFSGDLSSLVDGERMFRYTALESFNGDLSSLINGELMFDKTALESFSGDLSSLVYGYNMFERNQSRHYDVSHYKIVDGTKTWVTETFVSNGLKSFISNLSSLKCGYEMFGDGSNVTYTYTDDSGASVTETTKDVAPLNEESIFFIAETINDISSLDKTVDSDWTYTDCDSGGNLITNMILSSYRGVLHLGYDATTITDTSKIMKYCDQIAAKGWKVYLNGAAQVANNGAIETISLTDEDGSPIVIPHYYKPVQVTDAEIAEYVDQNGNYYIIVGGQHVFGDDVSTYGMFTSYDHAKTEIIQGLGLTTYEKPIDEETHEKPIEEEIEKKLLANILNKTSN